MSQLKNDLKFLKEGLYYNIQLPPMWHKEFKIYAQSWCGSPASNGSQTGRCRNLNFFGTIQCKDVDPSLKQESRDPESIYVHNYMKLSNDYIAVFQQKVLHMKTYKKYIEYILNKAGVAIRYTALLTFIPYTCLD